LADYSLSTEWWDRAFDTLATLTGTTYLVVKDDVFRASRGTNEDQEISLLTSAQPPDAIRAALSEPIVWSRADEPTRHRMVKHEIVNRFIRELMGVVKAIYQVPIGDFTAAELASSWGPAYTDRCLQAIASTGAIVPTGEKRDHWSVYKSNPEFDPQAFIQSNPEAAEAARLHTERRGSY
jgi:hypothetical protein